MVGKVAAHAPSVSATREAIIQGCLTEHTYIENIRKTTSGDFWVSGTLPSIGRLPLPSRTMCIASTVTRPIFDEHLDTRPEFGLSPEDVQICKGLLLDFYTIGFKRKEDLRTHDLGLVSKVRHRNTKTLHTYCSTWGILVCCV